MPIQFNNINFRNNNCIEVDLIIELPIGTILTTRSISGTTSEYILINRNDVSSLNILVNTHNLIDCLN